MKTVPPFSSFCKKENFAKKKKKKMQLKDRNSGLPQWLNDKESACQCRRHEFCPWPRKSLPASRVN